MKSNLSMWLTQKSIGELFDTTRNKMKIQLVRNSY